VIAYVESSAAVKLLVEEQESGALLSWLAQPDDTVSTLLTETELRRSAQRLGYDQTAVTEVLDGMQLFEIERSDYSSAGLLPGRDLRSLDALHLAAALRLRVDFFVTYDSRQASAATALGLTVVSPS
jgi:predicted nucleic acid-binding protein